MLAIVIPYYKFKFFQETLESLANQRDQRFKVYIGDDASSENPSCLLEIYKNRFSFEYRRFEDNLGGISLVKQWERCMIMANDEEWLMILGDDDVLGDNFVASFYDNLNEINDLEINVIRYATIVIDEKSEEISELYMHPKLETSIDFLMRKIKGGTRSSLSEFVFRSNKLEEIKFKELPLAWYSDYLAVLEVSNFSRMYTINSSVVYFRHSGINITSNGKNLKLKDKATFQYYYYLIREKKQFFNKKQQDILALKLEKIFLYNKKNKYFWIQITKLYLVNFQFKRYLLTMLRVSKHIF